MKGLAAALGVVAGNILDALPDQPIEIFRAIGTRLGVCLLLRRPLPLSGRIDIGTGRKLSSNNRYELTDIDWRRDLDTNYLKVVDDTLSIYWLRLPV